MFQLFPKIRKKNRAADPFSTGIEREIQLN